MGTRFRILVPVLVPAAALVLHADTTGRISGKVTSSDGKPIANAVIVLKRTEMAWSKELKSDAAGAFFQVGLEPKEFEMTVTAPGYAPFKEVVKIPLGEALNKVVVLKTPSEASLAPVAAGSVAAEDPSAKAENDAAEAYNAAAAFYSSKEYPQALVPAEQAYKGFQDALGAVKDEMARPGLEEKSLKAARLLGMVYFFAGKKEESKKLLAPLAEKNSKDGNVVSALLKIAKEAKDKEGEAKYQAMLDAIDGPRPEIAYNEGVTALNAGDMKGAKAGALKALGVKADYADAYYILGIAEFGLNNLKASKEALKKYMELAPNGSKAAEVKEMLRELR